MADRYTADDLAGWEQELVREIAAERRGYEKAIAALRTEREEIATKAESLARVPAGTANEHLFMLGMDYSVAALERRIGEVLSE